MPWRPRRDVFWSLPLPQLSGSAVERGGVPPPAKFSCGQRNWLAQPPPACTDVFNERLAWVAPCSHRCFLMLQCSTENVSILGFFWKKGSRVVPALFRGWDMFGLNLAAQSLWKGRAH